MADIKSIEQRSRNMAAIKGKNTKPEIYLRKCLFSRGYRYRVNVSGIPGHPDIWLRKYNTAVFVNGCFWHRHQKCKYAYTPKSRTEFWNSKFATNILRDQRVRLDLRQKNIRCLTIWECTVKKMIKDPDYAQQVLDACEVFLHDDRMMGEL